MTAPTVGLALIVKDEQESLPHLLDSVAGAFDQVVLVDTGSTDHTVQRFKKWARKQKLALGFKVDTFEWVDDFSAARAHADSLLETDWTCWADADDVIQGAENLRELAASAGPELLGFVADYEYAHDEHGNCVCHLRRERLVRRGAGEWSGRVHEAQLIAGPQAALDPSTALWVHRKPPKPSESNERNIRILRGWLKDEPRNPRVLGYLGTELLVAGQVDDAIGYFRRYLKLRTGWDEERAQIHRKLGMALISKERYDEAIATALEAVQLLPSWSDSYLTLAEAYHQTEQWAKCAEWSKQVLERGVPQTLLIVNPLDYVFQPRLLLASSLGAMAQIDEAIEIGEQALSIVPGHQGLAMTHQGWLAQRKREATAQTFCAAARQLIAHDEQEKALALLENTVPHFCQDHAEVVGMRSQLRERLRPLYDPDGYREHYTSGGSKPEDFTDDERVDEICNALPRCAFLLEGLLEQVGAAA